VSVRDVFQHQTPAMLAAAAGRPAEPAAAPADVAVGPAPLTPIMHALLERGGPIDAYSQSALVRVPAGLGLDRLVAAVQAVLDHHDVLRARLVRGDAGGGPRLDVPARGAVAAEACVRRVDVAGLDGDRLAAALRDQARGARERLAPEAGAMTQVVWFDAGD